jgi:hypothetical protein
MRQKGMNYTLKNIVAIIAIMAINTNLPLGRLRKRQEVLDKVLASAINCAQILKPECVCKGFLRG